MVALNGEWVISTQNNMTKLRKYWDEIFEVIF